MKKVRNTFGTYFNEMTMEQFCEVDEVAEELSKNWGNIPKYLSDKRAYEIHCLAKGYKALQRELKRKRHE